MSNLKLENEKNRLKKERQEKSEKKKARKALRNKIILITVGIVMILSMILPVISGMYIGF